MTKVDIRQRAQGYLAGFLDVRPSEITDDRVVGADLIQASLEDSFNMANAIRFPIFIQTRSLTFGQWVAELESDFDQLADWKRKELLKI